MPKTFVFVRHGDAMKTPNPPGRPSDSGLTSLGARQIRDAAEWLRSLGIRPDLIVHTRTPRTRESAAILLHKLGGDIRLLETRSGFRDMPGLQAKLKLWTENHPAEVVLFCGHHSTQIALTRALGLGLEPAERGVVVVGLPGLAARHRGV